MAGATQLAFGLALLAVALRYRSLTSLFLVLVMVERGLMALHGWVLSRPPRAIIRRSIMAVSRRWSWAACSWPCPCERGLALSDILAEGGAILGGTEGRAR